MPVAYEMVCLQGDEFFHETSYGPGPLSGKRTTEKKALPFGPNYSKYVASALGLIENYCQQRHARVVSFQKEQSGFTWFPEVLGDSNQSRV